MHPLGWASDRHIEQRYPGTMVPVEQQELQQVSKEDGSRFLGRWDTTDVGGRQPSLEDGVGACGGGAGPWGWTSSATIKSHEDLL